MRIAGFLLSLSLLAVPACAADEKASALQQGLGDIQQIRIFGPMARLSDFAPEIMDNAIVSVANGRGHTSYFVQAGTQGAICTAPLRGGPTDCEDWNVVAVKTDSGFSDVITADNDNAVAFVRALLNGQRQTLLLTARRSGAYGRPMAVNFTAYALHVEPQIDAEDISFEPVRSWAGVGSYCLVDAALWALTGNNRKDHC